MTHATRAKPRTPGRQGIDPTLWILAAAKLLIHLLLCHRYGYYRDELYFLACADRLDFGFVDHAPLVPVLTAAVKATLGSSLFALRLLPAIGGAGLVLMTGLLTRQMGGNRSASRLAALAVFATPLFWRSFSLLTPAAFETLLWTVFCSLILRILAEDRPPRWTWPAVGFVLGLGILNRFSTALLGASLLVGFLLSNGPTRILPVARNRWPAVQGLLLAVVMISPTVLWQARHGLPTLEFLSNLSSTVLVQVSALEFVAGQLFFFNPVAAPIWLAGLVWVFRDDRGARFAAFGWSFLLLLLFFLVANGKIYYLGPAYPPLLAAGSVAIQAYVQRHGRLARSLPICLATLLLAWAAWTAQLVLPVLRPDAVEAHSRRASFGLRGAAVLAGHFSDMAGWQGLAREVARHWNGMPAEQRERGLILAGNYGQAAALDHFGRAEGLPSSWCGHNSFYLWGLEAVGRHQENRALADPVCLAVGVPPSRLESVFAVVEPVAVIPNRHAAPYERDLPVYRCRQLRMPWPQAWPRFKIYR